MAEVYSYHTFLYPFLWNSNETSTMEEFCKKLKKGEWTEYKSSNKREQYAVRQYFNNAARKAVGIAAGNEHHIRCFSHNTLKDDGYQFGITVPQGQDPREYLLNINAVRLNVYNTGVAVMIYELEYTSEGQNPDNHQAVMEINEYGRRLFPPYLPESSSDLPCAKILEIINKNDKNIKLATDDFSSWVKDPKNNSLPDFIQDKEEKNDFIPEIIKKTIWNEPENNNDPQIIPAIDDRMFVCCCVQDEKWVNHFRGEDKENNANNEEFILVKDWDSAKELYALLNIDAKKDKCSCQSKEDINRYLSEQLYLRWIEYGTIHAVTNHSMICLTGDPDAVKASVVDPFLTEYVEMCILTIAQRASLIAFGNRVTDCAGTRLKKEIHKAKLLELQKDFSLFQAQFLLAEVTPQIQGIELYEKLQTMLFVDRLKENVRSQIQDLSAIVDTERSTALNWGALYVAVAALVLGAWQGRQYLGLYLESYLGPAGERQTTLQTVITIMEGCMLAALVVFLFWGIRKIWRIFKGK